MSKRILGDLRIFQAVHNDLKLTHEIVTKADGTKAWAYTYEGADPYELEDSAFPTITGAFNKATAEAEKAYGGCHNCYGKGYSTVNGMWHGYDTDQDIGSPGGYIKGGKPVEMKCCDCPRGTQLENLMESQSLRRES